LRLRNVCGKTILEAQSLAQIRSIHGLTARDSRADLVVAASLKALLFRTSTLRRYPIGRKKT
jgi:stage III sporulation protein SpoIIIAA